MKKQDLVELVAESGLTKKQAQAAVEAFSTRSARSLPEAGKSSSPVLDPSGWANARRARRVIRAPARRLRSLPIKPRYSKRGPRSSRPSGYSSSR